MQKISSKIFYSATDITHFSECQHLTWLDRLNLDEPMEKAEADDQTKLIQDKGFAHEKKYLGRLGELHQNITEIAQDASLNERVAATLAAIRDGAEVIYQATLIRGNLIGHADFLVHFGKADAHGRYQYEVADTKLAHSTKAKFILQLCFYSDLLADVTGQMPHQMHIELGDGKRESFRVADYIYYFHQLMDRFNAFLATYPQGAPPYPIPCDHCSLCHWRDRCAERRVADDHLSAVANITRQQVVRLEQSGVKTVAQLAALPADTSIPKLASESLSKLREQAALQVLERETGRQTAVVLPLTAGELRGFARLPLPDEGDLYFDMEGAPMQDGGLEYLFGIYYIEDAQPVFKCFWGHDREQERQAFVDFMDFVELRIQRYPGMHIYHYAHYEKMALRNLMSLHGVKESAVDQLLREHRMVDLYKVVREGLRISKPSYSLKAVEAFYAGQRSTEVKKATDSIVVYERWRENGDPTLLESIRQYNEDDCRSTWQLRQWLLTLRPADLPWYSVVNAGDAKTKTARTKSDNIIKFEAKLESYHRRLISHPENPSLDPELAKLMDSLLDFHRRAAKPAWWSLFERQDAEFEALLEDPEVIAGLHTPELMGDGERYEIYRFRYPEQDFKVRAGSHAKRLDNLREVLVVAIDEDAGTVDMELRADELPTSLSISIGAPVQANAMRDAVFSFADSVIKGETRYKSVLDYLARRVPDVKGVAPGAPIVVSGTEPLPQIISAVERMQNSYLFIQGPPGTGKTFTGSHLIAALLQAGKRVAVSANSHKVIINLLEAVDKQMKEAGASYTGMKKVSSDDHCIDSDYIENVASGDAIAEANPPSQLVAGTAWLLAKPDFWGQFDYLFIDEAGQVSLANMIAMGMCAKNLILLGDQMQLGQPIQGIHPGRSGDSALDYLLDGEATIGAERGIFLEKTFRMHPDVCRFISDAFYDSRLESDPSTFDQALILNGNAHPALKSTGIRYLPVEHDGCSQRSEEEAAAVTELVGNLLTQRYRNKKGEINSCTLEDILVVAPYNMQVNLLKRTLPKGARVGTVDKFQGQEAEVVIVSMATSSGEYLPRFIDFLFSKNRLNVAISRAKCLALVLQNPKLLNARAATPNQMALINCACHLGKQFEFNLTNNMILIRGEL